MKLPKFKGLFFWRKDPKEETKKAEEMLQLYVKYIPQIRKLMRDQPENELLSDGEIIGQMYDFYEDAQATIENNVGMWGDGAPVVVSWDGTPHSNDNRKEAKPVDVQHELEKVPTPFDVTLNNLDGKIETLKDKKSLLNQKYAKAQIKGLIKRLENRKQYNGDNAIFYSSFPNTTEEKIDLLLGKYKLVMKKSDLFIPSFPKEAIDIMKKYTSVTKKISGETPVYYVIAESKDFKKKEKKLDPILLVQSPFGFYFQILGAWDKELILLSEL